LCANAVLQPLCYPMTACIIPMPSRKRSPTFAQAQKSAFTPGSNPLVWCRKRSRIFANFSLSTRRSKQFQHRHSVALLLLRFDGVWHDFNAHPSSLDEFSDPVADP